jgi:hypothetical protein
LEITEKDNLIDSLKTKVIDLANELRLMEKEYTDKLVSKDEQFSKDQKKIDELTQGEFNFNN